MKKIILFICFIFLTGCSAEYNLVYENNKVIESLNVLSLPNDIVDGQIFSNKVDSYYNNINLIVDYKVEPGDMSESEIVAKYPTYKKSLINNDGLYGLKLGYTYELKDDYSNSAIVYQLFNKVVINDNYFQANNIKDVFSNYPELDSINITFKTDKKVANSNADKVENNIYYWNINKDNFEGKSINVKFNNSLVEEENILNANNGWNLIYIILGIIGVGILISIIVIYEKVRKSNN